LTRLGNPPARHFAARGMRAAQSPHGGTLDWSDCCSPRLARLQRTVAEHAGVFILPDRELVIVVDDDLGMLRSLARVLKQHGYDTILFASAEAFKAHNDYERATCIILDVNLNDGSGIELRRGLKAAGIDVPVIYMTANINSLSREAALQSGECLAYFEKPFPAKSLIEALKRASVGSRSRAPCH
jgi:FixJ family two-component response regulator